MLMSVYVIFTSINSIAARISPVDSLMEFVIFIQDNGGGNFGPVYGSSTNLTIGFVIPLPTNSVLYFN